MDTIAEVEKIAERKEELQGEVSALGKTIAQLENLANDKKLVIEGLEFDIDALVSQKTIKELELKEAESEAEKAQTLMRDAKTTSSATIVALGEEVGEYQAKIVFLKEELENTKISMQRVMDAIANEYATLEKVKAEHTAFIEKATAEKADLTIKVAELHTEHGTYSTRVAEKKAEVEVAEAKVSEVEKKLIDVNSELEAAYIEKERINTANMDAEKAHNESMMELAQTLDTEITTNRERITAVKEELAVVEKDLESKNAQAIAHVGRTQELDQREAYLKDKYKRAGIQW